MDAGIKYTVQSNYSSYTYVQKYPGQPNMNTDAQFIVDGQFRSSFLLPQLKMTK
jgi:hypothetical protein